MTALLADDHELAQIPVGALLRSGGFQNCRDCAVEPEGICIRHLTLVRDVQSALGEAPETDGFTPTGVEDAEITVTQQLPVLPE